MKPLLKTFSVLKGPPLGKAKGKNELWAYATVETPDMEGDVIRVKGMSTKRHETSPIKILVSHRKAPFDNGDPPVVGRVEEFVPTSFSSKGSSVPALAFRMSWAADGEGNLTDLASKYKALYDGGYLDGFSVGVFPHKATPIRGKGFDVEESDLFEISVCTIPINSNATKIAALKAALGDDLDDGIPQADEPRSGPFDPFNKYLDIKLDELSSGLLAVLRELKADQQQINKRLDDFECYLVSKSDESEQAADSQAPQAQDERIASAFLAALKAHKS